MYVKQEEEVVLVAARLSLTSCFCFYWVFLMHLSLASGRNKSATKAL